MEPLSVHRENIPLEQFVFKDGFMQVYRDGRLYTYWDRRIRSTHMNLIRRTFRGKNHGKKKKRNGLAPKGTTLKTTFLPISRTMLFEDYDVYEFLESLYPHSRPPRAHLGMRIVADKDIDICAIESLQFDTNKYTIVFKYRKKLFDPFEEHESGCVPALNVVCNYLKGKFPTDILVEHQGKKVLRIITKFKIQNFIQYLLSIKNDRDSDYWGIVQNEEKRTLAQIYSTSKLQSKTSVLRRNGYIDILSSHQSPDKILLLSYEVSNSYKKEDVFIFSHRYNQKWVVVMENIQPDRATEVFVTTDEMYDNCILCIYDYFTNYELERKRENFYRKKINPSKFYSLDYYTIDHDNISSWLNKMNSIYLLVPKSEQPFIFRGGLRLANHTSTRNISEQTLNVSYLHDVMMRKLYDLKVEEYGIENVETEVPVGHKRIDLVVKKGALYDFYEIKTYDDPGKCVQEAFGQILMYAKMSYWEQIDNLFVIGPNEIDHSDNWMIKNNNYDKSLSLKYISLSVE